MMANWRVWLKGLIAATVSAAANSLAVLIADRGHFDPAAAGGLGRLASVTLVSAIVGAAMYLKQSPLPGNHSSESTVER